MWSPVRRLPLLSSGNMVQQLGAHTNFVQGIAVDPTFKIIVSLSSDRTVRVWLRQNQKRRLKQKKEKPSFYQKHVRAFDCFYEIRCSGGRSWERRKARRSKWKLKRAYFRGRSRVRLRCLRAGWCKRCRIRALNRALICFSLRAL